MSYTTPSRVPLSYIWCVNWFPSQVVSYTTCENNHLTQWNLCYGFILPGKNGVSDQDGEMGLRVVKLGEWEKVHCGKLWVFFDMELWVKWKVAVFGVFEKWVKKNSLWSTLVGNSHFGIFYIFRISNWKDKKFFIHQIYRIWQTEKIT